VERDQGKVGITARPDVADLDRIACIDRLGELTDAAVGREAVAVAQHDDGLIERGAGGIDEIRGDVLAGRALQPVAGARGVVTFAGTTAELSEHGAGLDRGELVLVAEQDEARVRRQGVEDGGHHLQIDHGCLVDDQHIERQRVAGMVAQPAGVRATAEQTVERAHGDGDGGAHGLALCEIGERQAGDRGGDGFVQTRRGLAGGCRQADAQGRRAG
jgi:hypothetical protein